MTSSCIIQGQLRQSMINELRGKGDKKFQSSIKSNRSDLLATTIRQKKCKLSCERFEGDITLLSWLIISEYIPVYFLKCVYLDVHYVSVVVFCSLATPAVYSTYLLYSCRKHFC